MFFLFWKRIIYIYIKKWKRKKQNDENNNERTNETKRNELTKQTNEQETIINKNCTKPSFRHCQMTWFSNFCYFFADVSWYIFQFRSVDKAFFTNFLLVYRIWKKTKICFWMICNSFHKKKTQPFVETFVSIQMAVWTFFLSKFEHFDLKKKHEMEEWGDGSTTMDW